MKMSFSDSEISSMIEFSLSNGGAPIQIADFMIVSKIEKRSGEYQITVVERYQNEENEDSNVESPKPESSSNDGEDVFPRICIQAGCLNVVESQDKRVKYCAEHTRRRPASED